MRFLGRFCTYLVILIVCTSCKTSYNVLGHSHWGLGQFARGGDGCLLNFQGGVVEKRESPDFRSPGVDISPIVTMHLVKYLQITTALFVLVI